MDNSEQSVSLRNEDEFEKFMQESLSTDAPSSAESVDPKANYQLWWLNSKADKKENVVPSTSPWLKKRTKDVDIVHVSEDETDGGEEDDDAEKAAPVSPWLKKKPQTANHVSLPSSSRVLPVENHSPTIQKQSEAGNKKKVQLDGVDQNEKVVKMSSPENLEIERELQYSDDTFESSSSGKSLELESDDKIDSSSDEQVTLEQESNDSVDGTESEEKKLLYASDLATNHPDTDVSNSSADILNVEDNESLGSGKDKNFNLSHSESEQVSEDASIHISTSLEHSKESLNEGDKNENIRLENNENESASETDSKTITDSDNKLLQKITEYEKLLEQEKLEKEKLKDKISLTNSREKELNTRIVEFENKLELSQLECKALKAELEELKSESSRKQQEQQHEFEEKSAAFQKENILLTTKIEELELKSKQLPTDTIAPEDMRILKDQVIQLQKEIQDQEDLLQGFQKENERLYAELKSVQKSSKATESKLKTQNQQLNTEVTRLREQLQVMNRARNFKLEISDANKIFPHGGPQCDSNSGKSSALSSPKMSLTEDLSQRYQDEIRQLLELTKQQNEEKLAYELIHVEDVKIIEELDKKLKNMEEKMKQNLSSFQDLPQDVPVKKTIEYDIEMAKMKKLQSEVAKLQAELKIKEQEKEDISKFYEEEYEKIKMGAEKKGSDLRSVKLQIQPLRVKTEELRLELEASEERNKQLVSQLQKKRQAPRMSKAIQAAISPEKKRSDVVLENKELKIMIEKLECDKKEMEANIQIIKDETEKLVEMEQRECDLQIEQLKKKHSNELQKVITEMAAQHSTSKVAELMNKLQSQEILYGQIKEQDREIEELKNKIDMLQVVNSDLETEIKELRSDLSKTKSMQSPQMRDILALQEEIRELEKRQHRREEELHYLMHQMKRNDTSVLKQEITHWKQQVIEKNRELEYFRSELNTILLFLSELERQGITIPSLKSIEKSRGEASMGRTKPS